jgi:DNA-binding transcriptional ArsR family regulator
VFVLADEIRKLKHEGVSANEIAWRLGVAPTTVSYHIKALGSCGNVRRGPRALDLPRVRVRSRHGSW